MRVGWMEKRGHNVCGRPRLWKPGLPCARRGRPPRCPVSGPALAALRLSLRLSLRPAPKQRAAPGQLQPASRGPPPAGGWRLQPIEGDACAMRRVGDPRLAHDPPPMVLSEGANVPLTVLLSALPLNTDEVTRSSPCPPIFSLHSPLLTHFLRLPTYQAIYPAWALCGVLMHCFYFYITDWEMEDTKKYPAQGHRASRW